MVDLAVTSLYRDTALKRKVYDAVYERMLRYVVEKPPPDCTNAHKVRVPDRMKAPHMCHATACEGASNITQTAT